MAAIAHFGAERLPVLGVCLGHQAIGQAFGGVVRRAAAPVHGKTDEIHHDGARRLRGPPDPFTATRYHSLVVDEALPACLEVTAWTAEGVIMGVRHRQLPVDGVQFHPESVLTTVGLELLRTFLSMSGGADGRPRPARPPLRPHPWRIPMPNDHISAALKNLAAGRDLSEEEARGVLLEIMCGRAGDTQTAAFLSALRVKGETAAEIVGLARAMTELAEKVEVDADVILDTCGTVSLMASAVDGLRRAAVLAFVDGQDLVQPGEGGVLVEARDAGQRLPGLDQGDRLLAQLDRGRGVGEVRRRREQLVAADVEGEGVQDVEVLGVGGEDLAAHRDHVAVRFSLIAASSAVIWAVPYHFVMKSAYWPFGYCAM